MISQYSVSLTIHMPNGESATGKIPMFTRPSSELELAVLLAGRLSDRAMDIVQIYTGIKPTLILASWLPDPHTMSIIGSTRIVFDYSAPGLLTRVPATLRIKETENEPASRRRAMNPFGEEPGPYDADWGAQDEGPL